MGSPIAVSRLVRILFASRAALLAENLALRKQLAVLQRSIPRPKLSCRDRIFWVWLSRVWTGWRSALVIVQPDTVVGWHRQGFRLYWRWKSRRRKEVDNQWKYKPGQQEAGRDRVRQIMSKYGLTYHQGGRVIGCGTGAPARSLHALLRTRDLGAVDLEFDRALQAVDADPPAAVTAACATLEALCKVYIEDEGLAEPSKSTLKPLWSVVQRDLRLDPAHVQDQDLAGILSGPTSVVDGIASLRTHAGSAHGHGRHIYRFEPRHARLAIHGAHPLATFVLQTWEARKAKKGTTNASHSV